MESWLDTGLTHDPIWIERIQDLLPGKPGDVGASAQDNRRFVEAILYRYRAGIPWRDLPERFGSWKNTHRRFSRWAKNGVWRRVFEHLAAAADILLMTLGVRDFEPGRHDWRERLEGLRTTDGQGLPACLKAEITRECRRLHQVIGMIAELEAEQKAALDGGAVERLHHPEATSTPDMRLGLAGSDQRGHQCGVGGGRSLAGPPVGSRLSADFL